MSLGVIIFIAAILIVVMIHESGHFFVAKAFNFKATKYFVGFGPTLWSVHKGETEYGLKALPLGGFVKIVGMNPYEEIPPEDQPRSYPNKPRWQRALVIVAGSATHFVVAFLILFVTAMAIGFPTGASSNELAEVGREVAGDPGPAWEAGLRPGDRIVGIEGRATTSWDEIRSYIQERPGEIGRFTVARDDRTSEVEVPIGTALIGPDGRPLDFAPPGEELDRDARGGEEVVGLLGVASKEEYETYGVMGALGQASFYTWDSTKRSVLGIGHMFKMVFGGELWRALQGEGERAPDEGPLGLVGAGRIAGESVQEQDPLVLIGLIVGFTVFVGLMNLLPLPPLDGGHLAVLAYEALTKKTVDVRKLIPIAAAVISFFLILFVAVLYLDLARPVRLSF